MWQGAFIAPWDWRVRNKKTHVLGAVRPPENANAILLASASGPVAPSPDCTIKGNVNPSGECIYHQPTSRWYAKIEMKISKGTRWFCSVEEAEAAGLPGDPALTTVDIDVHEQKRLGRLRRASVILLLTMAVYILLAYIVLPLLWTHHEHQKGLAGLDMVTRTAQGIPWRSHQCRADRRSRRHIVRDACGQLVSGRSRSR
jgi:hypothetical protein